LNLVVVTHTIGELPRDLGEVGIAGGIRDERAADITRREQELAEQLDVGNRRHRENEPPRSRLNSRLETGAELDRRGGNDEGVCGSPVWPSDDRRCAQQHHE